MDGCALDLECADQGCHRPGSRRVCSVDGGCACTLPRSTSPEATQAHASLASSVQLRLQHAILVCTIGVTALLLLRRDRPPLAPLVACFTTGLLLLHLAYSFRSRSIQPP